MFDVAKVRKDFPILEEQVYGKRLVYLDNVATTQRPLQVIENMNEYYLKYNSNVHRGVHFLSNKCTDANEEAREIVRKFIHAGSDKEIIFTRGTTESINLVAFSFGEAFIREGDEILVTEMEHHANIVPWQMLCERKGAVLKVLPFNDKGELDVTTGYFIDSAGEISWSRLRFECVGDGKSGKRADRPGSSDRCKSVGRRRTSCSAYTDRCAGARL